MIGKRRAAAVGAHLAAVWLAGSALTAVQFQAVSVALFLGRPAVLAVVPVCSVALAAALLASLGRAARSVVPLTRRRAGLCGWTAGVYAFGTAGALAVAVALEHVGALADWGVLSPAGGTCHALAAAFLLPGARARFAALAAAVVLAAGGAYAAWDAARPPTLDEWMSANQVDRALLLVGDPPPGYALHVGRAGADGFGARYESGDSPELSIRVERAGADTRRVDARGCPVPFGQEIHCRDDGGGRLLIARGGTYPLRELRLPQGGLVCTVTVRGSGETGLPAARHVLATLRPATRAELAALVELPMPR
ncbi:hypothetical protein ABZ461_32380 [Actinacidiphila glaucinigra]|uniref:hypothetical protein n=1 Tax=Actinacidiphila glaucinigra TaxID=235986 RepID=UPI00340C2CA6